MQFSPPHSGTIHGNVLTQTYRDTGEPQKVKSKKLYLKIFHILKTDRHSVVLQFYKGQFLLLLFKFFINH
jgi:hypothetical protein